ncbi:hypothetical protein PHYPSEUDO_015103 [Phytophthora pseudosyringae]|uniref:Temptin Cys/Cys disulfide domain-containing protein n=1 Tax=Phytophthora pseudosyringae TaxID=221518 RepID=A0A8T1W2V7_9STRA|nr:hypothetical protein PHYPSEUDO_015103 [Phytophthora pseudosyringae]
MLPTSIATTFLTCRMQAPTIAGQDMYVSKVLNGGNVLAIEALGHVNPTSSGDGALNEDFASASYVWTKELCNKKKDSNGDDQANGQEMKIHAANGPRPYRTWQTRIKCNSSSYSASAAENLASSGGSAYMSESSLDASANTVALLGRGVTAPIGLVASNAEGRRTI